MSKKTSLTKLVDDFKHLYQKQIRAERTGARFNAVLEKRMILLHDAIATIVLKESMTKRETEL